ncbi:hypothetical protein AMTR_s00073p00176340 [Amborella trichopoda]|uniref:Uncharacterized protein n=1 Tax=Amborella trichopoda TaxID=13333 RepID=W1NNP5_AMBTC|nr:hypothetical protein AMTR_s00073p00176340 [Amborella trichopoda]
MATISILCNICLRQSHLCCHPPTNQAPPPTCNIRHLCCHLLCSHIHHPLCCFPSLKSLLPLQSQPQPPPTQQSPPSSSTTTVSACNHHHSATASSMLS